MCRVLLIGLTNDFINLMSRRLDGSYSLASLLVESVKSGSIFVFKNLSTDRYKYIK